MAEYRYSRRAMMGDYTRSGLGLLLSGWPLAVTDTGPVVTAILAGIALLFLGFGLRTGLRHASRIRLDDERIWSLGLVPGGILWRDLASVGLNYYSTKRGGGDGWMQLTLKSPSRSLKIESTLEGFTEVVERAAKEALSKGAVFTPETTSNLKALGIGVDERERPMGSNV